MNNSPSTLPPIDAPELRTRLLGPDAKRSAFYAQHFALLIALGYDWMFVAIQLVLSCCMLLVCLSINTDFQLASFGGNYAFVVLGIDLVQVVLFIVYPLLQRRTR